MLDSTKGIVLRGRGETKRLQKAGRLLLGGWAGVLTGGKSLDMGGGANSDLEMTWCSCLVF